MATNAGPVYGRQYIRYAETYEAEILNSAGTENVEVGEYRVVKQSDKPMYATVARYSADPSGTEQLGVNQSYMPTTIASPQTARQLTVARSGLLLVEVAPAQPAIVVGTGLQIDSDGAAVQAGGVAVTVQGTTPIVREYLNIAGRAFVLVSFA